MEAMQPEVHDLDEIDDLGMLDAIATAVVPHWTGYLFVHWLVFLAGRSAKERVPTCTVRNSQRLQRHGDGLVANGVKAKLEVGLCSFHSHLVQFRLSELRQPSISWIVGVLIL
jgi:hypothetical protein